MLGKAWWKTSGTILRTRCMSAGRLAKNIVVTDFPLEDLAAPPVQAMFASFFFRMLGGCTFEGWLTYFRLILYIHADT
jgi:hypothetical protein